MAWKWGKKETLAAQLVAEDALSDEAIAARVGIARTTLAVWKGLPEFSERVTGIREALRKAILKTGIADKVRRVERLNDDWERLAAIRDRRGAHYQALADERQRHVVTMLANGTKQEQIDRILSDMPEVYPGAETGLIVRTVKVAGGQLVEEFGVDTALLAERRALEMQAAKELGQWIDRKDVTSKDEPVAAAFLLAVDKIYGPPKGDGEGSGEGS